MNETKLSGLENLRSRFARLAALPGLKPALRAEAEAVARDATARLSSRGTGELARTIEVIDMRGESRDGFLVGTGDPAGFFVEFGTFRTAGNPWLLPALHARLPRLKHNLRTLLADAVKSRSMGVASRLSD